MYVHYRSCSEIIIHFEIIDYFEFCENHGYSPSFINTDNVNIEYNKFRGKVVHDIISHCIVDTLFVNVEDIGGLSCSFKCNPRFHSVGICKCQLLEYFVS